MTKNNYNSDGIIFEIISDSGTLVPLSDSFKLNKMFEDYRISYDMISEIVNRIQAISNASEKLVKNITVMGTDLNPNDTYVIKQDISVGKLSSHYEIEYNYNAGSINPDNMITRKLSLIIHATAIKKYEIIFKEDYVFTNSKFDEYGTKCVLTTNRLHSKKSIDQILNWLRENIEIWQSES